jgi:allantoate deiminase
VRDAGKYDGMLGVIAAIECVAQLHASAVRLPFAIEVIGFADEEGVRFSVTLLGSRAVAGTFDLAVLDKKDASGIAMREALIAFGLDPARIGDAARRSADVLAYAELHIEQGPVLEAEALPVGVVTAINGGYRFLLDVEGMAGHAGTVPMGLRRDALAACRRMRAGRRTHCPQHAGSRRYSRADRSTARRRQRDSGQGAVQPRCARADRQHA